MPWRQLAPWGNCAGDAAGAGLASAHALAPDSVVFRLVPSSRFGGCLLSGRRHCEVLQSDSSIGRGVLPRAIDPKIAERLWTLSEELTGVIMQALSGIAH